MTAALRQVIYKLPDESRAILLRVLLRKGDTTSDLSPDEARVLSDVLEKLAGPEQSAPTGERTENVT